MDMHEIIFAGFGGQGIQTMSKVLSFAAMDYGYNVSWLPSYGPEMRGGTSNCTVIISSEEIGSPIVTKADIVVAMNNPSLIKFESHLKENGILIIDSDLITIEPQRNDIEVIKVPAQDLSIGIGNKSLANMIILGALLERTNIVPLETLIESIKLHSKEKFFELNKKALNSGAEFMSKNLICQ